MHKKIGIEIMKHHRKIFGINDDSKYDADKQVIQDSYKNTPGKHLQKSFEETMKHRNENVNKFCEKELNYDRGDDLLQIGMLSITIVKKHFRKMIMGNHLSNVSKLVVKDHRLANPIVKKKS